MFPFRKDRLKGKKRLGKGQFGEVFPYQKTEKDFDWVVKRMEVEKEELKNLQGQVDYDRTYEKLINNLLKCFPEIVIGFSCDHPCIVPVRGYFIEKTDNGYDIYLKMPRMKMSLADEFKSREYSGAFYEEAQIIKYFYSLVSGVDYLHKRKIFHRDIKINNVLIDEQGYAKLSDVGSAKHVANEDLPYLLSGNHGAEYYKAPELIQYEDQLQKLGRNPNFELLINPLKKDSLEKIDSWSLGLTMLELCSLKLRLVNPSKPVQDIQEALNSMREKIEERGLYRKSLLDLIIGLLRIDPEQRLRVSDLKMTLEAEFKEIITEEYKMSLGLSKDFRKVEISDVHLQMFEEGLKDSSQRLEEVYKKKMDMIDDKIKNMQEKLQVGFKSVVKKLEIGKNKEIEELRKRYEGKIESLEQENLEILKRNDTEKEEFTQRIKNLEKSLEEELQKQNPGKQLEDPQIKQGDHQKEIIKQEEAKEGDSEEQSGVVLDLRSEQGLKVYKEKLNQAILRLQKELKDRLYIQSNDDKDGLFGMFMLENITDQELEDLAKEFVKILKETNMSRDLISLGFRFSRSGGITDARIKSFSENITVNLKNLNHFHLNLTGNGKITDVGVKSLSENIGANLKSLTSLRLEFNHCNGITDKGVRSLSENISNLKNLKKLCFNFECSTRISDEGIKSLSENIAVHLKNLVYIYLDFTACGKITDEGVKILSKNFAINVKNLVEFFLILKSCHQITDAGIKSLSKFIEANLKSLKTFCLDCWWCNVSHEMMQSIENQVRRSVRGYVSVQRH